MIRGAIPRMRREGDEEEEVKGPGEEAGERKGGEVCQIAQFRFQVGFGAEAPRADEPALYVV